MIQGGLGGLLSVGLLWLAVRWLTEGLAAGSDLLGRAPIGLPPGLPAMLVLGGMVVGVVGSLVSLRRVRV